MGNLSKMMIEGTLRASVALLSMAFAGSCAAPSTEGLSSRVDPLIGSGGHGHVFVGANVPFGMVQLGPQQIKDEWDWCSGYNYTDTLIIGFGHTHLSGTGIGDLGDIMFMPYDPARVLYDVSYARRKESDVKHIYAHLDHGLEHVSPGLYTISLPDYGVDVRLTATERTGLQEYTFTADESAVLVDLCTGIGWDGVIDYKIEVESNTAISGYRRSSGWAADQLVYFYSEFSEPWERIEPEVLKEGETAFSFIFNTAGKKKLLVRTGISAVSAENARLNLEGELPGWNFDDVASAATAKWDAALSRIRIEPMDEVQERIFYTALYHTMIAPSIFSDVSGDYRGADGNIHNDAVTQYTTLSLWDTYRAAYPLMSLIDTDMARALASTFMNIYRHQGKLPVWHLVGNETDCMVGNPGVIILGDYVLKGLYGDATAALEAMAASSMRDERGMEYLKQYGYIPFDKSREVETVAKGLEFAIADAAVARVASAAGDADKAEYFGNRSESWRYYFDPSVRFMRGRASDGSWRTPFDPFKAIHMKSDFTEGNAWQYTWLVPHNVYGLVDVLGGEEGFIEKLDSLFIAEGDLGPDANDVTGLIGQYAHGNEPGHHIPYLYNYVGRQDKCARIVREVLSELYVDDPDGICGNEDVGQMSAWYVLSAMGLYQVDPCGGPFMIGSPAVKSAVIEVGGGKTFTIVAHDNTPENIYVASVTLNGAPLERSWLEYDEIMAGGTLELQMVAAPSSYGQNVRELYESR